MSKDNGGPASDKIQQARRAAFREIFANAPYEFCMARYDEDNTSWPGNYVAYHVECAWKAFNAALDCVVIELPTEIDEFADDDPGRRAFSLFTNTALRGCRAAIESTNLGIKVK